MAQSPFGKVLVGFEGDQVCFLEFDDQVKSGLRDADARVVVEQFLAGEFVPVSFKGTEFQNLVWLELGKLERGELISYSELAARVGRPKAVRAVASAVARNPICLLVPCHRVIAKTGDLHKYRFGAPRKKAIIEAEMAVNSL